MAEKERIVLGSEQFTKIKLKAAWLGHPKGATITIKTHYAQKLLDRGSAMIPPIRKARKAAPVKVKTQKPLKVKVVETLKAKSVSKPNKDKMVKRPVKNK